jgi:nicotinamidase/pyrazinamidase
MEVMDMEYQDIQYESFVTVSEHDALLVVDMQNDFMPKGALPVDEGDMIVNGVNSMMKLFNESGSSVVLTQDWHPEGHHSFASAHEDKEPYDVYDADGLGPVLWPDHCVQGSAGAAFHHEINTNLAHGIIRKGYHLSIDSYSGFVENDKKTSTGLNGYLKDRKIRRVFVCGLALDYCVFYTAEDALNKGYEVYVILDLTKAVASPQGSVSNALEALTGAGAKYINYRDIRSS